MVLDIAQVAQVSGIPASALRYYEEKGLIASIGRRGLRRLYGPGILDRLALIALGQQAGFSLAEIAGMFAPDGRLRVRRDVLTARADALERAITRLAVLRDGLRHAAACPKRDHEACPTFRRLMKLAAARQGRQQGHVRKRTPSRTA